MPAHTPVSSPSSYLTPPLPLLRLQLKHILRVVHLRSQLRPRPLIKLPNLVLLLLLHPTQEVSRSDLVVVHEGVPLAAELLELVALGLLCLEELGLPEEGEVLVAPH